MPSATYSGLSYAFYLGDGSTTTFPLGFDYLKASHVVVKVDGVTKTSGTHYNLTGGNVVFVTAPAANADIRLLRETPLEYDDREVDFRSFGAITEDEMDLDQKQTWFLIQEADERDDTGEINPTAGYLAWDVVNGRWTAIREGVEKTIGDLASPTIDDEAATKGYVDSVAEWGIAGMPQGWTFTTAGNGTSYTLTNGERLDAKYLVVSLDGVMQVPDIDFVIQPGSPSSTLVWTTAPPNGVVASIQNFGKARFINSLVIEDNSIESSKLTADCVTDRELADEAVDTGAIQDSAVTEDKIADDAVTASKIADESVDFNRLKESGFTTAPGGTYHPYLRVNKTTGTLEIHNISATDISDWLTELGNVRLSAFAAPNASVNMGSQRITNVATPTATGDAATKSYVDSAIGTGNASKIELLYDSTLGAAASSWTIFSSPAPSWFGSSDYLYYTCVVSNWVQTPVGANEERVRIKLYQGGAFKWAGYITELPISSTTTPIVWQFRIINPRTGSTKPWTGEVGLTLTAESPGFSLGAGDGLQIGSYQYHSLAGESGLNINAGARIQIYGHKALS